MSRVAHVHLEPTKRVGEFVEVAANFTWPAAWPKFWRDRRQRAYVRVPADLDPSEHAVADAMLLGSLFPAMRRARVLKFHGRVSEDLLANVRRLRDLWVERRPDKYGPVEIEPDGTLVGEAPRGPAVLPFSGGLDSTWSLVRMTGPLRRADDPVLGLTVMIHGADVPIRAREEFGRAFDRARRIVEPCGVPLARVETNLRELRQNWTHSCNAALGAVLTLFRRRYGEGRIAVGYSATEGLRWWPQDVTDPPLLSCRAFPIAGDGLDTQRPEKLEQVVDRPEVLANLRVCYNPEVLDRNCGECMKCQTGMLFALAITGGALPCFPREALTSDVHAVAASGDPLVWRRLAQFVRLARRHGHAERLADVAAEMLATAGRDREGEAL